MMRVRGRKFVLQPAIYGVPATGGGGGGGSLTFAWTDSDFVAGTPAPSVTFTGKNIGSASSDRYVVVAIGWRGSNAAGMDIPSTAKLVAQCGWSWNLAFALARAIRGEGANAAALQHEGIPAQAARGIADAIAARPAPVVAAEPAPAPRKANSAGRTYVPKSKYYYRGAL